MLCPQLMIIISKTDLFFSLQVIILQKVLEHMLAQFSFFNFAYQVQFFSSTINKYIDHSRKYHTLILFVYHPKFCISIVFSFSWGHFNSQEKLKTMLMQNFGVTNKEHYGMLWYFWSGQLVRMESRGKGNLR